MSAICGIIRTDGEPVGHDELRVMVESMPYRGPDGTNIWIEGNAGLAHLAFHVTPESVFERQPLTSADGRLVLVADVRLDNRAELAGKLGIRPQDLAALTDPELIFRAYQNWGEACLDHLLGDFVFAIWNRNSKSLFLARDPLGNYGLTVHRKGTDFFFASEIAAILDLPEITPIINEDAVAKTLAYMSLDADETFFQSIQALPPAHFMQISASESITRRYWDIDPEKQIRYRTTAEYTEHFLDLLTRSVDYRIRTFGEAGISLSGGYDSTLLAAIAAKRLAESNRTLRSFSNVFKVFNQCDERRFIEPVVRQYQIDPTYIYSDSDWTLADLPTRAIPRDFFWNNAFARLPERIAGSASDAGCRVLIDGMAGDPLFCEPSLVAADLLMQGRITALFALLWRNRDTISWRRELISHGVRPLVPRWMKKGYRRLRPATRIHAPGLSHELLQRLEQLRINGKADSSDTGLPPGRQSRYRRVFDPSWAIGFAASRSIPYNRSGVERVSPYRDRQLIEFVMAIPAEQVSHAGRPRKLQNNAMRMLLPEEVYARKEKTNFTPLLHEGLVNRAPNGVIKAGSEPLCVRQGWIEPAWLENQLKKPSAIERDGYFLSDCLHLELWLEAVATAMEGGEKWSTPCFRRP